MRDAFRRDAAAEQRPHQTPVGRIEKDATVEDIMQAYIQSWKLGAKAISIYRDGSKRTQPLNTSRETVKDTPQYHIMRLSGNGNAPQLRRLSDYPHPYPSLRDLQKEVIRCGLFS